MCFILAVTVLELVLNSEHLDCLCLNIVFPNVEVVKIEKQTIFSHRSLVDSFIEKCSALRKVYVDSKLIYEAEPDDSPMEAQCDTKLNYVSLMDQSVYYTTRFTKPTKDKPFPYYVELKVSEK